ncbi:MAG: ergot alkaloid biosynthesis protein [Rhizomicrobium sp.]
MSRILVTGGTGKTGRRLAARLRADGTALRVASRAPNGAADGVVFDWNAPETWDGALDGVTAAYLVAPARGGDPAQAMIGFVQAAMARGMGRFVLLSASLLSAGGPGMGQVHQWLHDNAPQWAVIRPSWFMQNFSEGQHLATIRDEDAVYSAAQDGRVPFLDAEDIARVAQILLTRAKAPNADFILTGPRAISYDDVARSLSAAAGRPIAHRRVGADALAARHRAAGLPELVAQILAMMDTAIAGGAEDRVTEAVAALTGHPPADFDSFARANAAVWRN